MSMSATTPAAMNTWGTTEWNWGSPVGAAHDAAATLRGKLATPAARLAFVQRLRQSAATWSEAELALALTWQRAKNRGKLGEIYEAAYDALVSGKFVASDDAAAALASAMAPGVDRYCLNVCLKVKPERLDAFWDAIRANEIGTRREPRYLRYSFGVSTESDTTVYFQEQFVGQKGFDAHAGSPHFASWEAFAASDPFSEPPDVKFWRATASLADEEPPAYVAAAVLASLDFVEDGM